MTDRQTDEGKATGGQGISRGIFFGLCLFLAAILITIWIKLASKDIDVEAPINLPAIEQSAVPGVSKTADQGGWYVSLASFRLEKDAVAMLKRLAQKGVKADYVSFIGSRKGYQWYRVRVSGFANEQAAQDGLVALSKKLGIRKAWVGKDL